MIPKICKHAGTNVAHEPKDPKLPAALFDDGMQPLGYGVAFRRWSDNRTRRSRLRTRLLFCLRQSRFGPTGEKRRQDCARAADAERTIPSCAKLLRRAGLARSANSLSKLRRCDDGTPQDIEN